MIRVLLLIPTLDGYGAEKQLALLACGLPKNRFDVHVAVLTRTGPYETVLRQAGVKVSFLNKRLKFDPFAFWKLRKLLNEFQPDILHTWLFAANAYGRLVVGGRSRREGETSPRVVVSERCVDVWKAGWQLWLDRKLVNRTDRLVANSRSVADFYVAQGVPRSKVLVVPNAVEVERFARSEEQIAEERKAVREMLQIPSNAKLVGYVGRFARQKRVEDLVWAAELLWQVDERAYAVFVGEGPEKERIQRFVQQIHKAGHIRFLDHQPDVAPLIRSLDLFWLASDFEGMSNSLMEAMAAGKPVVVSNIAPNRELVTDGVTGLVVPVGDRVAFAKAAGKILSDPDLARRLGQAAQEKMKQQHSVSRMVDSYARLYEELAGASTSPSSNSNP